MAPTAPGSHLGSDPGNRLLWRHSPRRLEAEEIRDAMLAVAGNLDLTRPLASPAAKSKVIEMRNNGGEAKRILSAASTSKQRSIYLPLLRTLAPRSLEVFDFAEQGMVTGKRDTTTVAPQALYLLNDPFVLRQSLLLGNRLLRRTGLDDTGRIRLAYRLALGRPASPGEIERVNRYLDDYQAAFAHQPPPKPASPVDKTKGSKPAKQAGKQPAAGAQSRRPANPRAAAWASFCQALLASAEFRFLM